MKCRSVVLLAPLMLAAVGNTARRQIKLSPQWFDRCPWQFPARPVGALARRRPPMRCHQEAGNLDRASYGSVNRRHR